MVRITVNSPEAAAQVARIRDCLDAMGCAAPLVGDFHFNGHKLLTAYPDCAKALAKYRINPGNVGRGAKRDEQCATMIETACRYKLPIKIVVLNNGGIGGGLAELPTDSPLPPRVLTVGARYDKMMEAFGGKGFYVDDPKDLRAALDAAMKHDGPALVNVKLQPEAGRKPQQFGWLTT